MEMRHYKMLERIPLVVKEKGFTFKLKDVSKKEKPNCGNCTMKVYDPAGFHYCKGSGLRVRNEQDCDFSKYGKSLSFSNVSIYTDGFWQLVIDQIST